MDTPNSNDTKIKVVSVCCAPSAGWAAFWGILLITLGGLGLLSTVVPLQSIGRYILPALLVLWGGTILFNLRQARS